MYVFLSARECFNLYSMVMQFFVMKSCIKCISLYVSHMFIDALLCLQIPGQENLLDLLYSGCHNISVTSVNECGMSTFSSPAQVHQPPGMILSEPLSNIMTRNVTAE